MPQHEFVARVFAAKRDRGSEHLLVWLRESEAAGQQGLDPVQLLPLLFQAAQAYEQATEWHKKMPSLANF